MKPDLSKQFHLRTDASTHAYGSMLTQGPEGSETIVAVDSRQFTKSQVSWSCPTKELWSVCQGVKINAHFLIGKHSVITTDNQSVFHTLKEARNLTLTSSNPVTRSIIFLNTFDFTMKWSRGTDTPFHLTDLLSRKVISLDSPIRLGLKSKEPLLQVKTLLGDWVSADPDAVCHIPGREFEEEREFTENYTVSTLDLVVPNFKVIGILTKLHNHSTNLGTLQKLEALNLWFENTAKTVAEHASSCDICTQRKSHRKHPVIFNQVIYDVREPFIRCHLDNIHVKPLYVTVCVDFFSGYVEAAALYSEKTQDVIEVCTKLLIRMHLPRELIIDNARSFTSDAFSEMCTNMGIVKTHPTKTNSRSNGKVERVNRTFQERLKTLTGNGSISLDLTVSELDTVVNLIAFARQAKILTAGSHPRPTAKFWTSACSPANKQESRRLRKVDKS